MPKTIIFYLFFRQMETVSIVIKMENEEETEDGDTSLLPKVSCEEIIKHERQE
jgi:hypothetical protein